MHKAFIFDMDGVMINSENVWITYEQEFHKALFGEEITKKIGDTIGLSLEGIYNKAIENGFTSDRATFYNTYNNKAKEVYKESLVTDGLQEFIHTLQHWGFHIGLVSASPMSWIEIVLKKAEIENTFDYILSLHERDDLSHKPAPDGYLEAMKYLQSQPETTIILEDSNRGIRSGKASGAYTIGFSQHLIPGYIQEGADAYAGEMKDVERIVANLQTLNI